MNAWRPDQPRFPLLDGPTPLVPLPRFSAALGAPSGRGRAPEILMKREDLIPLAFGGNKTRNLEFLVGAALADGADALVTSGRRWSNHCRLTAAAAALAGVEAHLILTGPAPQNAGPNQRIAELLGASVHFTNGAERSERDALVARTVEELTAQGRRPSVIGVGGSGVVGAVGQVLAGQELAGQVRELGIDPDLIVLATATGVTQAGLLVGLRSEGLACRIIGFSVAHPADEVRLAIESTVRDLSDLMQVDSPESIDLRDAMTPGYGHRSEAADDAAALLARTEGILADPIYTAKALAGLVELARSGQLAGRTVVFWHGGGTLGLFETLDGAGG